MVSKNRIVNSEKVKLYLLRSGFSSVATTLLVHLMQLGKLSMSSTRTILAFLMLEVLVSLMSSSSRSVSMTAPMSLISAFWISPWKLKET